MMEKPPIAYLPTTIDSCTNQTFSQHISPLDLTNRTKYSALPDLVPTTLSNTDENDEEFREQPYNVNELDLEIKETKIE